MSRAMSALVLANWRVSLTSPRSFWMRRSKSWRRSVLSSSAEEIRSMPRISRRRSLSFATFRLLSHKELRVNWQLVRRQPHGLLGDILADATDLEEDAAGFDHRDPVIWRALA